MSWLFLVDNYCLQRFDTFFELGEALVQLLHELGLFGVHLGGLALGAHFGQGEHRAADDRDPDDDENDGDRNELW